MDDNQAVTGGGDVPITIDGKEYVLKPTLRAAIELSRGDGLTAVMRRCNSLELDALVQVVSAGLGRSSRNLPDLIYKSGMRNIHVPCIQFISNLSNGGIPIPKEGGDIGDPTSEGKE